MSTVRVPLDSLLSTKSPRKAALAPNLPELYMLLAGNLCHSDLRGEPREQVTAVTAARSTLPVLRAISIKKKRDQHNPNPQLTPFEENTGAGKYSIFFSILCKEFVCVCIYTHTQIHIHLAVWHFNSEQRSSDGSYSFVSADFL